jgi:LPS export ABC transporter protein LptC
MLNRGSFLVTASLIFLVVLTSWYAASLTRIIPLVGSGLINMGVLTNATVTQTTATGALQYKGSIKTATEFNNGNINFDVLNLIFFGDQPNQVPWNLTADAGTVIDHNSQINLQGHVIASRLQTGTTPPILIQTDSASIYPDTQLIKGSSLITFSQPGSINKTTAVGFVANLQAKWLKLLSQVRSVYAPH